MGQREDGAQAARAGLKGRRFGGTRRTLGVDPLFGLTTPRSGRPSASRGSGAIRASGMRPATLSLPGVRLVSEGFDTLDLKEAKALLDQLAA